MSTLKVNAIRGTGASSDAISVNSTDGTCTAKITNRSSNLIINGSMICSQRGTSGSGAYGYYSVDRWYNFNNGLDENPTIAQADVASSTSPYNLGFRKSLKVTNGNQTSGAGTSDQTFISTTLEAQDIANSGWNYTSTSSYITLSFWVKASVAQTYYGFLKAPDGSNYIYPYSFALSANTWTKVTKTIAGNSNLQFDNDNGAGLEVGFYLFLGTDLTASGVSLDTWAAYSGGTTRTPDQTSTWYTTNDSTFEITGVQLEVSDHATDFEHRSFGDELHRCQRYYVEYDADLFQDTLIFPGASRAGTVKFFTVQLPNSMRGDPTVTRTGYTRVINADEHNSGDSSADSLAVGGVTPSTQLIGTPTGSGDKVSFYYTGTMSNVDNTNNAVYMLMFVSETGSQLTFDAEL